MRKHTARCYNSVWLVVALLLVIGGLTAIGEKGKSIAADLLVTRKAVMEGEVWRLVTYAFIHPNPIWLIFHVFVFYYIAAPLELTWGTQRFLALVIVSVLAGGVTAVLVAAALASGWAVTMTLMLIHGLMFPESRINLFLVLPIRVRTLALAGTGFFLVSCVASGIKGVAYFAGMLVGAIYYVISTRSVLWARKAKQKLVGSATGSPGLLESHTRSRLMARAREIIKKHGEGAELTDEDRTYIEALIERSDPSKELCSPYSFSPDNDICPPCSELGRCLRRTIYGETSGASGAKPDNSGKERGT